MRRHAKASSAGLTQRQSKGLGSVALLAIGIGLCSLALGVVGASAAAPTVVSTGVSAVTTKTAVLEAEIEPGGEATAYHFEYGVADCSTTLCASAPDDNVGSGNSPVTVTEEVEGLSPGTTYHFRVVATNGSGPSAGADQTFSTFATPASNNNCPNEEFRVGPAALLPDCRGYEMVSPVDKNNGDIVTVGNITGYRTELNQSSLSGDAFTYSSYKAFAGATSSHYTNQYLARRGPGGWQTESTDPPLRHLSNPFSNLTLLDTLVRAFTPDLSKAWYIDVNQPPLDPDAVVGTHVENLYVRDNEDGEFKALTTVQPPNEEEAERETFFPILEGKSRDGNVVFFSSPAKLTPEAHGDPFGTIRNVYEYSDGTTKLVSILPNGEAATENAEVGGGAGFEGEIEHGHSNVTNAVSEDGSRVVWSAGGIFSRINGDTTVEVASKSEQPFFQTASTDGSKVLYTTQHELVEFNVDTETRSVLATELLGGASGGDSGVVGASDDLSYIYFVSRGNFGAGATPGEDNLYLYHDGAIRFVATLSPIDLSSESEQVGAAAWRPGRRDSRVTPDGRNLAFMSSRSLTGYDNRDVNNGEPAFEVFLYDADSDRLICASCNPTGARPVSQRVLVPFFVYEDEFGVGWAAAWIPASEDSLHAPRPLSSNGRRLFFNSYDALAPQDTNGAMDVYEWEAQGSGDCEKPAGCVSLISSGTSKGKSEFVEATPDGSNVFFRTESSLAPQDPGLFDIYDARIDGGFPVVAEPAPCVGDACQSVPPAPNDATPASASFRGAGNPGPRKARKRCSAHRRHRNGGARHRKKAKSCSRSKRRVAR